MNALRHARLTLPRRRAPWRLAILSGALALVLCSLPLLTTAARAQSDQPTIVLVHGAWAGPSSWHTVHAARFTGLIEQAVETTVENQQGN